MAEGAADSVEIRWARELHEDTIVDLIKLGDLARSTLGLLPHAVYREAAERNQIVAALSGGRAVAYVLFRLPRDEVVLTHLCVDPEFRRSGIAKALVDEVSQEHRHRLGIKAKCRNDYNLDGVWRRLGFDVRGPTKGRGRDQAAMTVWWLDHGHPDLFTPPAEEATPVRVALDANIVLDLHGPASASRASRSEVLKAPHLADRIQLVLTRAVDRDIQIRSDDQRQRLRVAMELYTRVPTSPRAKTLFDQMLTAVQREFPNYPVTPQDEADLWHLAEAASAGVDAFVTWDRNLRQKIAPLALGGLADKRLGRLCVLDPYHLEPHLEELSNAAAYSPDALLGSALTSTRAGANFDATLTSFLQKQLGEKWAELSQLERALVRSNSPSFVVRSEDGDPVGCYAMNLDGNRLEVPLFRVSDHPVGETLARALLWDLRKKARDLGALAVSLTDPYLSPMITRVAETESYRSTNTGRHAIIVDTTGDGAAISATATSAHEVVGLPLAPLIRPGESADNAARYERMWWPAKVTDSDLRHFAVPIKPKWSAELFGIPTMLVHRRTELALGRQQVYYRSPRNSGLVAPSRIVWYTSKDDSCPAQFVGTSLLDGISTDTPSRLHALFARYGVFRLEDIAGAAGDRGQAQALQLSDLEVFQTPVRRRVYDQVRERLGGPRSFQSPCALSPALFREIYRLGQASQSSAP